MRRVCAVAVVPVLLLAACGEDVPTGGGGLPPLTTPSGPVGGAPTSVQTLEGAKLRVVNFYLPEDGKPVTLDVLPGLAIGDQDGVEPIHTLELGESTDYFAPPASGDAAAMAFFAEGARAVDAKLMQYENILPAGAQWTVVLSRGDSLDDTPSLALQVFDDLPDETNGYYDIPAPAAGKGQIVGSAVALVNVMDQDNDSFQYGIPGQGCLAAPDDGLNVNVGGTSQVPFDVDPGTVQIAAYDPEQDISCSGEPALDPVEVEIAAGERVYVLAWSRTDDPADRELFVLPTK